MEVQKRMMAVREETTRFQPLVCTRTGFVSGWDPLLSAEAAPTGVPPDPAEEAWAAGQTVVVAARRGLVGPQTPLFLRLATGAFQAGGDGEAGGPEGDAGLRRLLASVGLRPADVVFELPESALQQNDGLVRELAEGWRYCGYRLSIAGLSIAGPAFDALSRLQPAFARFDPVLIADIDRQSVKFNLVEALLRHTRRLGVRTIAGDVTRRGELDAVVALGIDLIQGPRLCGGVSRPSRSDMLAVARAVLDAHMRQADGRSSCAGCGAD